MRAALAALLALLLLGLAPAPAVWTPQELATLKSLSLESLGPPKPDPTNRVADDPEAAKLGAALFADEAFSGNGKVSCATCHRPDAGLTDPFPLGRGVGTGNRRTMAITTAAYSPWMFWDGRADSPWAQALGPVENPVEHGFTRTQVAWRLTHDYRAEYERLFGPPPDLSDRKRFPERASPAGDAAAKAEWARMAPEDQATVDRVFSGFGKAIEAFERTFKVPRTRFDAYVAELSDPKKGVSFTADELAGLRIFIGKGNCTRCHNGPLFTNHTFANTGVPMRADLAEDLGREAGIAKALADPFDCHGKFNDAPGKGCEELDYAATSGPELTRAFKVPSLRGVADRAPYMETGQFATLDAVVDHYSRAPAAPKGTSQLTPLNLDGNEKRQLIAFLKTLSPVAP